jgi:hypothetical protein
VVVFVSLVQMDTVTLDRNVVTIPPHFISYLFQSLTSLSSLLISSIDDSIRAVTTSSAQQADSIRREGPPRWRGAGGRCARRRSPRRGASGGVAGQEAAPKQWEGPEAAARSGGASPEQREARAGAAAPALTCDLLPRASVGPTGWESSGSSSESAAGPSGHLRKRAQNLCQLDEHQFPLQQQGPTLRKISPYTICSGTSLYLWPPAFPRLPSD